MANLSLHVSGVRKAFNRRTIFSGINFSLHQPQSFAITGRNGSGKSTLLKIIAGVLSQTNGTIDVSIDGVSIEAAKRRNLFGFIAPYLQLYDEFTAWENLEFSSSVRGIRVEESTMSRLLDRVNLYSKRDEPVRTFSSGMKQRLKYCFAL